MMPDRTDEAKHNIMVALTDKWAEMTGEVKDEIIIFNDIPLKNASLGGVTCYDDPDK